MNSPKQTAGPGGAKLKPTEPTVSLSNALLFLCKSHYRLSVSYMVNMQVSMSLGNYTTYGHRQTPPPLSTSSRPFISSIITECARVCVKNTAYAPPS